MNFFSGMEEVHEDDMEPERKKLKVESVEAVKGINRLFVYCKGGNFNILILAWLGYFIC